MPHPSLTILFLLQSYESLQLQHYKIMEKIYNFLRTPTQDAVISKKTTKAGKKDG